MQIEIFPAAEDRIEEIWQYTLRKWGREQANEYVRDLGKAIEAIPARKRRWRTYQPKRYRGLRFIKHRHHYIFFSELDKDTIGILTVLHENMDFPERLNDDIVQ